MYVPRGSRLREVLTWMTGLRGEGPRLLEQAAQLALLLERGEARSA